MARSIKRRAVGPSWFSIATESLSSEHVFVVSFEIDSVNFISHLLRRIRRLLQPNGFAASPVSFPLQLPGARPRLVYPATTNGLHFVLLVVVVVDVAIARRRHSARCVFVSRSTLVGHFRVQKKKEIDWLGNTVGPAFTFVVKSKTTRAEFYFYFFVFVVFEGPFYFGIGWTEGGDGNHWAGVTHCSWPGSLSTYRLSTEQRKSGGEERKISKQERKKGIRPTKNKNLISSERDLLLDDGRHD